MSLSFSLCRMGVATVPPPLHVFTHLLSVHPPQLLRARETHSQDGDDRQSLDNMVFITRRTPHGLQASESFDTNDLKALVSVQPPPLSTRARDIGEPITKRTSHALSSRWPRVQHALRCQGSQGGMGWAAASQRTGGGQGGGG